MEGFPKELFNILMQSTFVKAANSIDFFLRDINILDGAPFAKYCYYKGTFESFLYQMVLITSKIFPWIKKHNYDAPLSKYKLTELFNMDESHEYVKYLKSLPEYKQVLSFHHEVTKFSQVGEFQDLVNNIFLQIFVCSILMQHFPNIMKIKLPIPYMSDDDTSKLSNNSKQQLHVLKHYLSEFIDIESDITNKAVKCSIGVIPNFVQLPLKGPWYTFAILLSLCTLLNVWYSVSDITTGQVNKLLNWAYVMDDILLNTNTNFQRYLLYQYEVCMISNILLMQLFVNLEHLVDAIVLFNPQNDDDK